MKISNFLHRTWRPKILSGLLYYILEAIYKIHFKGITKDGIAYSAIEFERDMRLWESLFEDYHRSAKDGLKRTMNVVKELVDLIKKISVTSMKLSS